MAKRIDAKNVDLYYGAFHAVQDVSLTVEPRTVTAFIGPSGCGKSTFLRTLNRMHEVIPGAYVKGSVTLDGTDLYGQGVDPVAVRRVVGMVFQRPNPFPSMSIFDNVAAGLRLNGVKNKKVLEEAVERSLVSANLWTEVKDRLGKAGMGLSGGQQQQLAIGRALMGRPSLLVLDEPTEGVQPSIVSAIEAAVASLKGHIAILLVEQYYDFARSLADRYVVLERGAVAAQGARADMDRDNISRYLSI
jgi:phosphate transport system ATP-binding protein